MLMKDGTYINSTCINEIIYEEVNVNDNKIYMVEFEGSLLEIKEGHMPFGLFNIVPGFRMVPTIEENMEFSFIFKGEKLYFEKEGTTRYVLNFGRIKSVSNVDNIYWRIVMIDNEEYWFKAFEANFKPFISKLIA